MQQLLPWFLVLIVLAMLFIVVPLFAYRKKSISSSVQIRQEQNLDVYQNSIHELEQNLQQGLISNDEFETLKSEMQRTLLNDVADAESENAESSMSLGKSFIPVTLMVIPLFSLLLYMQVGAGDELYIPEIMDSIAQAENEEQQTERLNQLADALQQRWKKHDDDIRNGYMLGTLYMELERFPEAVATLNTLAGSMEPGPDKATVLGQLAQAQYLRAEGDFDANVQNSMEAALALNPEEPSVLGLLAIQALLDEDLQGAVNYWRRQLLQEAPGSRDAIVLQERISRAETVLGSMQTEQAGTATEQDTADLAVTINVSVDDAVLDQVTPDMRVFVFARGESAPVPLAAATFSLDDLPLTVTLDDSMAMTPQFRLSSAQRIYVGARISRQATAQSGDFQAISDLLELSPETTSVDLVITEQIP